MGQTVNIYNFSNLFK